MKNLTHIIMLSFLISCGSSPPVTEDLTPSVESTTDSINELFSQAVLLSGNEAFVIKIEAIEKLIEKMTEMPDNTLVYAIGNQVGVGQEILELISTYRNHG